MSDDAGTATTAAALPGCRASRTCRTGRVGWIVAITLHAGALGWLSWWDPPRTARRLKLDPVKVRLATRAPAPPPAARSAPPPAARVEQTAAPRRAAKAPRRQRRPSPPRRPSIDTAAAPSPAPPAPPPRFTVALTATVPSGSGGVAVPTSPAGGARPAGVPEWAGGRDGGGPGGRAASPGVTPARPFQITEVTSPPRLVTRPSGEALRRAYPARARADGLEANVVLRILVGANGQVVRVRVVRGAGNGFDEAATRLVTTFQFEAGKKDGRPVAVWIPWTYKFRLNG